MTASTIPETGEFTLEQRQRLGQVYAMILRWNREDDLLHDKHAPATGASQPSSSNNPSHENAVNAETKCLE